MKVQQSALALGVCVSAASAWATPFSPIRGGGDRFSVFAAAAVHERKTNQRGFVAKRLFSTSESVIEPEKTAAVPVKKEVIQVKEIAAANAAAKPGILSLATAASVLAATVGTFVFNNYLNMGPVKASSLAGLIATIVLPEKLAIAAFAGSFAGMAKTAVVPGLAASGVLGLVCAAMIILFDRKQWLVGVGGRLGFISQCACTTYFLVAGLFLALSGAASPPAGAAALIGSAPLDFSKLAAQFPMVASLTVVGALFMRYWKHLLASRSKRLSNLVGSVSATGLIAGLALPASMAGPIFCGSFVAMAAPTKLPTLMSLVYASILAGAAQQSLAGVMLGGWGGKLGTAALMGVLAYRGLVKALVPEKLPEPQMANNNMKVPK